MVQADSPLILKQPSKKKKKDWGWSFISLCCIYWCAEVLRWGIGCTAKHALFCSRQNHAVRRRMLSAVSCTGGERSDYQLTPACPRDELTCHFPRAVKAFVTVIACFLFLLISLSGEWSGRIESATVCDSRALVRLYWQRAVFWLTGCSSKICMKLFFHRSPGWWRRKGWQWSRRAACPFGTRQGHSGACVCSGWEKPLLSLQATSSSSSNLSQ